MANGRLTERNAAIAAMLADGEKLKNFYYFIAQNPHINLHDACQIILGRPNATVCYSFTEWSAMDRRVIRGRKGIAYYDVDGYKQFVFDANDTRGDTEYMRPILPMKCLLGGLDELTGTEFASAEQNDYQKIHKSVQLYLQEQGDLSGDVERDKLLIEGTAYSLYSRTGFPKSQEINLSGLPYAYLENAELVKEVYIQADMLAQDIEETYRNKRDKVIIIDDTEAETVSDEPVVSVEHTVKTVEEHSTMEEQPPYETLYKRYMEAQKIKPDAIVLIKNGDSYEVLGENVKTLAAEQNYVYIHVDVGLPEEVPMCSTLEKYVEEFINEILERHSVLLVEDYKEPRYIPTHAETLEQSAEAEEKKQPEQIFEVTEPNHPIYPLYKWYMELQNGKPNAIVLLRYGDFYEVWGEKAKVVSDELHLTLTGRNVGLSERIPMCGIPQHFLDEFLNKILENHGVLLAESDDEPMYILSHAETLEQSVGAEEKLQPKLTEIDSEEPSPFDDEQSEQNDDWRSELAEELGELVDEQSDEDAEEVEIDEDEELDETDESSDEQDEDEDSEQEEKPKAKGNNESTQQKPEKGIKDRKRKEKLQLNLFDVAEPVEESREDKFVNYCLREEHSGNKVKFYDAYQKNLPISKFAELLKKTYGESGHYSGGKGITNNRKGKTIEWKDKEHPENNISVHLKWNEVAIRIAELIKADNYLTVEEKREYARLIRFREERNNAANDEERCDVIANQIIEYGTKKAYCANFVEYPHFLEDYAEFYFSHKEEINERLLKRDEVLGVGKSNNDLFGREINVSFRIKYCPHWQEILRGRLARKHRVQDFANGFIELCAEKYSETDEDKITLIITPKDIPETDYLFIKDNRDEFVDYLQQINGVDSAKLSMQEITLVFDRTYISDIAGGRIMQPSEQSKAVREIADKIIKDGTETTTEGNSIILYEDLNESEQFAREHANEIAIELEDHQEVSDVMLTQDGLDTNFFTDYCPKYVESADSKKENTVTVTKIFNRFKDLTEEGKAFFESYQQRLIREPTYSPWDEVQACRTIAKGIYEVSTAGHGGVMISTGLAPYILSSEALEKGIQYAGYYCYEEDCDAAIPLRELYDKGILNQTNEYFTHYSVKSERTEAYRGSVPFNAATEEEKAKFFEWWNNVIIGSLKDWNKQYWQTHELAEVHEEVKGNAENTDLAEVLDQSELGGAKTRFRNNVEAIKLVNRLYAENRNPTEAEKKVLAKFVGWGGLSQVFDEKNPQWKKEYAELKGLLSQEDYEQARGSTLNAYYTSKDVINGIYMALNRFGVKGNNRILEPAMGTGNFFGFMPMDIANGARLYGVELDNLTGRIAAKLYTQANVQIKGFEDTTFPNDKFDIVVGNVPFGGYGVADSDYNRYNFRVHDYFLAKSIDKVKPNGIVAIVTSKGTMDKINQNARKYVAERAELLGAIRLPNTAFKQTAGTEAVADILFFRKREKAIAPDISSNEWLGIGKTEEGYEINNYFIQHPEMVLGTLFEEHGLYGGVDVTVKPDGRELSEAIAEAIKNLSGGFYDNPETAPAEESTIEVDYNVKPMCFKAENGRLYMRVGDEMQEQAIPKFPKDAYQRIQGMIALRKELHHILDLQIQGCSDEVLEREQRKLNAQYDLFVKRYGELNGQTNTRLFKEDGDSALLFACEEVDEDTKKVSKSDIFFKRTIRPYVVPTNTDDCFEALQISKNERGRVDISYIEELTGKSYDDVLFELGDSVFRNPKTVDRADKYSGFETSEEYLSGRVVEKLNIARRFAEQYPEYQKNIEALEKVQPTPLTASEISVRLGQTWIDKEIYKQFYMTLVGVHRWHARDVELFYNPHDSSWRLDQKDSVRYDTNMKQKEVYGTKRAPAYRLFIDCMNLKATTIYDLVRDENGNEKRVLNHEETIAAREKQNKIKEEFANWIFADPDRREELVATYNRLFNQIRLPSYDGSYLKFPEMNPAIELRPHQKNAIHRIITHNEGTLLHHVVGSGKTYTMAASIMKMRQLGLCKKAMVAVPNHLVQQWASEWRKLYPNAKILVATKEDLEKNNRQKFVSKVALGVWDGIIIAQSSFAKIPVSIERQINKLNDEIWNIELTIGAQWEENGMPRGAVKNLERIKKTKKAQLKKLMDSSSKDSVLTFENLGIDYLYIDEAHYYKNLFLFTKMNNVAGISNAASQRASDLKLKCEYLQEIHGSDKGIVFATGTPISNSMAEMYTMQSYLQPRMLLEIGIEFFDGWAADFGETITSMELAPSGQGYKARTRFAKFTNLPELLTMYRSFADVQTADMVKLNVPEAERHVINLKPSDTVIELAEKIAERAEIIHGGGVPPEMDNMLKVTSDGKKLALDPRCFVPESADEEGSKLNEAAQRIYDIWESTADKKGTQIVFCDLSTPKVKSDEYVYGLRFDAYNDFKYKLVQKGMPADEIAFIHDANTDEQKQALFDKVNSGDIRVLIGSTEKCGAGTNVQKRLVALHHLDTPYRPSDMEQREGRIIRQGNTNEKVDIYTYVTERTFDSYSYQILENKQKFIAQINKGDLTVREAEDIDETTLNYAEIKAITAANPRIKRKMEVDTEIARLRVLEGQYRKNIYDLQDKVRKQFPEDIRKQELLIERVTLDLMHLNSSKPTDPEAFEISVNGKVYTDRKEGGKALTDALYASKPETVVAEYCGFKISMNPITMLTCERDITLTANGQYVINIGESASGNLTRLDNFLEDFPKRKERLENKLKQLKDDLAIAEEQLQKPFEHKAYLSELLSEQAELNAELNLDKKEESVIIDDGSDSDDDNYRMIPTQRNIREDIIIDEEDKVAAMKIDVLPDYSITQDDMHDYGYKWDGMLPISKNKALKFWTMGLTVCKLGKDDDHVEVDDYSDFENDDNTMYGIEKPEWKNYLHNEKSAPYLFARLHVTSAVSNMISEEMSDVDKKFIGKFKEDTLRERADLDKFLRGVNQPDNGSIISELSYSIDEVTNRLWCNDLKHYGWIKSDIPKSITTHIADKDLKNFTKSSVQYFDVTRELMIKLGSMSEEKIDALKLPNSLYDELTVIAKQPDYVLDNNEGSKQFVMGVLLLRNEITGEYYVINDTSARDKDGKELEVGDTTDAETLLAYEGLYDGNPLHEFRNEREARVYYDDRVRAIRSVVASSADYREAVKSSVFLEYDELQKAMLNSSPREVLNNHYKIHCYERLSSIIEEDTEYFSSEDYKTLYKDKGKILDKIYNDYILPDVLESNEPTNLDSYDDIVNCIKAYCRENHSEIYYDATYYGKDTENRAYYRFTKPITNDSLKFLKTDAEMHTIAAPECMLTQDELEKNHVFYLKIGRDISEDALEETDAMSSMMNAMDNYYRIFPVYLHTAKYSDEHYEMIDYRNSHKSNEECKRAIAEAISANYDGMHLNVDFEDKLIEKYGMERVAFIVATTINEHEYDGRFSHANKEWAKTIPMSESEDERGNCCLNVHPAILDGFADRIRSKQVILYTTLQTQNSNGLPCYNAYFLNRENGKIELLLGDFSSDLVLQATVDQDAAYRYKGYQFKRVDVNKLYETSERLQEKIKNKEKKLEQDKYLKVTPMGYEVLEITKDKDNRNIAIIYRERQNDYIVGAGYNTTDGKWEQGEYCATLEAAREYRYEKYDKFVTNETGSGKKDWIFAHVAKEALVKKHQFTSFFRFHTYSDYSGYGYSIFNNRIKEGRQIADMQSDSRELCYDIRLDADEEIILKHSTKEEIKVTGRELMELVSGTLSKDYDPKPRVEVNIPKEAKRNVYDNSTMFVLPNSAAEEKFTYFIPNRYITNGTDENEGRIILSIPEDFEIKAQNKDEEEITYTLQEFVDLCNGTTADDYKSEENADGEAEENSTWHYVSVDKSARVAQYDNSTLFKMPKGEFEGYTYYIPNGFLTENEEKGTIRIGLPEDFIVKPKDNVTGDEKSMTVVEFVEQVKNKKPEAYRYFQKPSEEAKAQFAAMEERLRRNIPEEMKNRPNWVAITTFEKENGKLGKRPIDCNTGKYASDNDPATWADFDTACKFARENGAVTLAYALDGEDKIACIDLDGCMQENGDFSELAQKTFNLGNGTYSERSVSGKGLHIFGKTDGMDLRSFSKDGDMEFYRKVRFIAVTGDYYGSSELKSFDTPEMKGLLEKKFDKRPVITNAGRGVEGFSTMSDRDVYDRACAAYKGERFKALFEGQDLQNNHSNSDMSLMNLLAFWCNGDKDQMLRMFAASGLYRPEKSQDYYECTMLKALEGTTDRYNPKPKTEPKKPVSGNGSGNNGKR